MLSKTIKWDIYEIITESNPITGVKLRGRVRKFCLEKGRNILIDNAEDIKGRVRFAIPSGEEPQEVIEYIESIVPHVKIVQAMKNIGNPVLSKLKVNIVERYN